MPISNFNDLSKWHDLYIRREDSCAVLGEDSDRIHGMGREIVRMIPCVKGDENQQWIHTKQVNPALHKAHLLPSKMLCSLFQIFEVLWGSLESLGVPEWFWRFLEVLGGSWRFLEVPRSSWGFLGVSGGSWRFLEVPGGSWRFLEVHLWFNLSKLF